MFLQDGCFITDYYRFFYRAHYASGEVKMLLETLGPRVDKTQVRINKNTKLSCRFVTWREWKPGHLHAQPTSTPTPSLATSGCPTDECWHLSWGAESSDMDGAPRDSWAAIFCLLKSCCTREQAESLKSWRKASRLKVLCCRLFRGES